MGEAIAVFLLTRNRKTFVVSAGLHRCPDHVERTQRLARYATHVDAHVLSVNRSAVLRVWAPIRKSYVRPNSLGEHSPCL